MAISIKIYNNNSTIINNTEEAFLKFSNNIDKVISYIESNPALTDHHNHINKIHIILVDKNEMIRLNSSYRNKEYATDVLTFQYQNDFDNVEQSNPDVEIYICDEVTYNQSIEYGTSIENELTLLGIHGILHGFGMDHETSFNDKQMMQTAENSILKFLNINIQSGIISR